jgi:glycosyltransferase involved in cell wall biosynthesis
MASAADQFRNRINFVGAVPFEERAKYFVETDVFVHPARHDGWGVVIQEAMAAGLPVIATRQTGAAYELVKENENGFLIEAGDEAALAEKIVWFAQHQDQIPGFSAKARSGVSGLTPKWAAAELVQIFGSVLGNRSSKNNESLACDPIDSRA